MVGILFFLQVLGNVSEFHRAVKLVIDTVSFDKDSTVQVFEANIRWAFYVPALFTFIFSAQSAEEQTWRHKDALHRGHKVISSWRFFFLNKHVKEASCGSYCWLLTSASSHISFIKLAKFYFPCLCVDLTCELNRYPLKSYNHNLMWTLFKIIIYKSIMIVRPAASTLLVL